MAILRVLHICIYYLTCTRIHSHRLLSRLVIIGLVFEAENRQHRLAGLGTDRWNNYDN